MVRNPDRFKVHVKRRRLDRREDDFTAGFGRRGTQTCRTVEYLDEAEVADAVRRSVAALNVAVLAGSKLRAGPEQRVVKDMAATCRAHGTRRSPRESSRTV